MEQLQIKKRNKWQLLLKPQLNDYQTHRNFGYKGNILKKSNKKSIRLGPIRVGVPNSKTCSFSAQCNARKERKILFLKVSVGGLIFFFLCHGKIFLKAR